MMKHIKKTSIILLWSFSIAQASAPAPDTQKITDSICGNLYVVGNMKYLGEDPEKLVRNKILKNILDENNQPITIKSSVVIAEVCAESDEAENWSDDGHPALGQCIFPRALPISMLEEKKEGDPLQFKLKCPNTQKIFNILLLCKGCDHKKFETQIDDLKKRFSNEPCYNFPTEKRLLAQQIIIKNPVSAQIQELEAQLSDMLSLFTCERRLIWETKGETAALEKAIAQKKAEWETTNKLTSFGTVPAFLHGPNGFKLTPEAPAEASSSSSSASSKPVINPNETE